MSRIGWLDCSSGVSGDMLLGALADLGALDGLPQLVASLGPLGVSVETTPTSRAGLRATAVSVNAPIEQPHRRLAEVQAVIDSADVPDEVRARSLAVFGRLAAAEAKVHGIALSEVEFHEVGAVDSITDVLGACLGLHALALDRLVVSPIALGGGSVRAAHGTLPVPTPAALELLAGTSLLASSGGDAELATPTGIAIAAEYADSSGPLPPITVLATGVGAGQRDPADRANVVRLVVGDSSDTTTAAEWLVVETNVDDLDPRLWPGVIAKLIEAGAADAWLTPILMKKGRPAHTLSALTTTDAADAVQQQMFTETSTIGVRWHNVGKRALDRRMLSVDVDGKTIRVKLAYSGGELVSATPEFEDVAAAAAALGVSVKALLREADRSVGNALRESSNS